MLYDPAMTIWSASEARAALPEILDRVEAGEEAVITRHGKPVAVVVRPDSLRARRADAAFAASGALHDTLERAAGIATRGSVSTAGVRTLVRELRADRDRGDLRRPWTRSTVDVLIYAATPEHALGRRVAARFERDDFVGIGSVRLLPELLTRPTQRIAATSSTRRDFVARLDLRPVDVATVELAVVLGATHRLRGSTRAPGDRGRGRCRSFHHEQSP